MITLGRSVEGRQILGLKIAADTRSERPLLRPQVKFSANIHGDEAVCREMLIGLARSCRDDNVTKLRFSFQSSV